MGFNATADEGFDVVGLVARYVSNHEACSSSSVCGSHGSDAGASSSMCTGPVAGSFVTPGSSSRVHADVGEYDEDDSSSSSHVFF